MMFGTAFPVAFVNISRARVKISENRPNLISRFSDTDGLYDEAWLFRYHPEDQLVQIFAAEEEN